MTDSPLDDIRPQLCASEGWFGLLHARAAVDQGSGDLLFRASSLDAPWEWSTEETINDVSSAFWNEGYCLTSRPGQFGAVWTGRIVGDDGDVFYDGNWRGLAADEYDSTPRDEISVLQDNLTGLIEVRNTSPRAVEVILYNVLGQNMAHTTARTGTTLWTMPRSLPSGAYWLMANRQTEAVRIQIVK